MTHGHQLPPRPQAAHGPHRRRPGRFHRPSPQHRRHARQSSQPCRRSTFLRPRQGQGVGPRLRHQPRPRLRLLPGNDPGRAEASCRGTNRFCFRCHPQPHALPEILYAQGKAFAEASFNVHVRQADDLRSKLWQRTTSRVVRREQASSSKSPYTTTPARWCVVRDHGSTLGRLGENQRHHALLHPGLAAPGMESEDHKQAAWRTDPQRSGAAGCFGDIGTHAYNLGRFITGLLPDQISCQLKVFRRVRQRASAALPSSATPTGQSAPSPLRRSLMAGKTTCGSRSMAPRAPWSGIRKSRTR